jgi:hypothetical protein
MKVHSSQILLLFGGLPVFLLLVYAWQCATPNANETISTPLPVADVVSENPGSGLVDPEVQVVADSGGWQMEHRPG